MSTKKVFQLFLAAVVAISTVPLFATAAKAADVTPLGVTQFAAGDAVVFDNVLDSQGNVYTATVFKGALTVGGVTYSSPSTSSVLVTKSTSTMVPVWSKLFETQSAGSFAVNLRVSPSDELIVGGMFSAATMTVDGVSISKIGSGSDGYLAKFSATGSLQWLKRFGSAGSSSYNGTGGLAIGGDGSIYARMRFGDIVGAAANALSPFTFTPSGTGAAWVVVKFNASGTAVWAKQLPSAFLASYPLDVNAAGQVIVSGWFNGAISFPIQGTYTAIGSDGIIIQISADGAAFDNIKVAGGSGAAKFNTVRYLSDGSIVTAMEFSSDTIINGVTYNSNSAANLIVAKFSGAGWVTDWANVYAGTGTVGITHITSSPNDSIYVAVSSVGQAGFVTSVGNVQSILALEITGATRWIKTWDSPGAAYAFRIAVSNTDLYIGGQADANLDFGSSVTITRSAAATAANGTDAYLLRLSLPPVQSGPPSFVIQKTSARVVQSGQTLKISGLSMKNVKSVQIGSLAAEITAQTDDYLSVKVPSLNEGPHELKLIGDTYLLNIQAALSVKGLSAKSASVTAKAKAISPAQVVLIQNLVGQFRQITSITCSSSSKALAAQACRSAISQRPDARALTTVILTSGQKQRVEIEVKGLTR
jgi:hypothetical protein